MALKANAFEFDADYVNETSALLSHNIALREHVHAVSAIKQSIEAEDYALAADIWWSMPEGDRNALWVAPSKGGIFTTKEREIIKSGEFTPQEQL